MILRQSLCHFCLCVREICDTDTLRDIDNDDDDDDDDDEGDREFVFVFYAGR